MNKKISVYGLLIWGLATAFYLYEFCLQVFLGTVADSVMLDLSLRPEQFAFIGSAFYIAYSFMQPNVGILADKFGVRRVILSALLICILGVFVLEAASGFLGALIARLLIGIGSSCAFVSILVLTLNWFSKRHFGTFVGLAQFLGALGPLLAGAPLAYLVHIANGNWRLVLFGVGVFGMILFAIMAIFLQNKPKGHRQQITFLDPSTSLKVKIREIRKNLQVWCVFAYGSFIYASLPLLGAYWGPTYLKTRGFSNSQAAFIVSLVWLGMAIFCPLYGFLSQKYARRKIFLISTSTLGMIISCLILYLPFNNAFWLSILFFSLGASSASQSLTYPLAAENTSKKNHSLVLGLNNFFITIFIAIVPPIATFLIQLSATRHTGPFDQGDFTDGFVVLPILYFVSLIVALFGIRETFCRQRYEVHRLDRPSRTHDLVAR